MFDKKTSLGRIIQMPKDEQKNTFHSCKKCGEWYTKIEFKQLKPKTPGWQQEVDWYFYHKDCSYCGEKDSVSTPFLHNSIPITRR